MPAPSFHLPALRPTLVMTCLLIVTQIVLALTGVHRQGVTHDETAHITAGYAYWTLDDYRLQPENGNLPQRWCALPLLALRPTLDPARQPEWWALSDVWRIAHDFFYRAGNNSDRFLFAARCAMMVWGLLLALLVRVWAGRLWGPGGGVLALAMAVFSPTLLAHAPLATSDVTAAVCLLAATGAWWANSQRVTPARVLLGGAITGLAFIAKFSAVLLLPMFAVMGMVRLFSAQPIRWTWRGRSGAWSTASAKLTALAGVTAIHAVITVLVIWTAFGWRYEAMGPEVGPAGVFYKTNELQINTADWIGDVADWTREHRLLPQAYIQGFAFVRFHSGGRAAFLAGDYRADGWWWFFPAAFLWKSTEGEILIAAFLAGGVGLTAWRWKSPRVWLARLYRFTPLLVFGAVYGATSLLSALNIGQRHILPLYAVLFIFAGGLWKLAGSRQMKLLACVPVVLSAVASLSVHPNFLTYFNVLSGGPRAGWRKLVDSSLDWGQGLPALKQWLGENRRPGERVYLSYFGSDDYRYRGINAVPLAPHYQNYEPRPFVRLQAGLYCLGATMLQDPFSPASGPWTPLKERDYQRGMAAARRELAAGTIENRIVDFGREGTQALWWVERLRFARLTQYLRVRRPDAIVANSILLYRLTDYEVETVINGTSSALADLMEQAMAVQP